MGISQRADSQGDRSVADVRNIKRRFQALNHERLRLVHQCLKSHQQIFLEVLPLLFHINHPALPGYVSEETPIGLADYQPSKHTITAARSLSREFKFQRRAMHTYNLHALYMMGSTGTVAYSEKSDFDIWVVHRPELSDAQVEELHSKCNYITEWAATLGLEANFFVLTAEAIRDGRIESMSEESSGSAQHLLLKEEFYRTALLVAGRYPAWWLVPPQREHEYQSAIAEVVSRRFVYDYEFVDFGAIGHIPADEFFGATLWHLNKAIGSPYKSVLKLLLMEAYASEFPKTELLATRFKQAVYDGETNIDNFDPYILMMKKVQEYLSQDGRDGRLELVRRCFYFKIHEKLSVKRRRNITRRYEVMQDLARDWEWGQDILTVLDSRDRWKIHRVLEETQLITRELTRSYRALSEFARRYGSEANIDQADLNLLGRRLYVAFERKAGKVELINPGISVDLSEDRLSFLQTRINNQTAWSLYREPVDQIIPGRTQPLKRKPNLLELVAWCHFNRLIGSQTQITLYNTQREAISSRELFSMAESLAKLFPEGDLPKVSIEALRQPARVVSCALYINQGIDPFGHHTRQGIHLTSNRHDALSYGGNWKNLIMTCDMLVITSWGEVLTSHYQGDTALLDCMSDYLSWTPLSAATAPPPVQVYSFSTARGISIAQRAQDLFSSLIKTFYSQPRDPAARFILHVGHDYYLFQVENDVPRHRLLGNEGDMVRILGEPQGDFSRIVFDDYAFRDFPIGALFKFNKPNIVQMLYYVQGNNALVYILDERGSLFYQKTEYHDSKTLISQYHRFLSSVMHRRQLLDTAQLTSSRIDDLEFYEIKRQPDGQLNLQKKPDPAEEHQGDYMSIQVIGDRVHGDEPSFSLYCNGVEFTHLEHGEALYAVVVEHILEQRNNRARYPIYITDIDVSPRTLNPDPNTPIQTVHFLNYKKKFEIRLNTALNQV